MSTTRSSTTTFDPDAEVVAVVEEEVADAPAPRARKKAAADDETEEDEEEADPDDVEADLDTILKDRIAAADDEEDEEEVEVADTRGPETPDGVTPEEGQRVRLHRLLPAGQPRPVRSGRQHDLPGGRERLPGHRRSCRRPRSNAGSDPWRPTSGEGANGGRPKNPVDQWFELFVYAPLGFALDARQLLPRFIDRGRSQVVLARVVGRYAVKRGSKRAGAYLDQSGTQMSAVLQALGLFPDETGPGADPADLDEFEGEVLDLRDRGRRPPDAGRSPTTRPTSRRRSTRPRSGPSPSPTTTTCPPRRSSPGWGACRPTSSTRCAATSPPSGAARRS